MLFRRLLPLTYFPKIAENRMSNAGNLELARERFYNEPCQNLRFLLQKRYSWMNDFILNSNQVVELGSGAGFSKEYLQCKSLILTDIEPKPWIDKVVDALDLPFAENSIDILICNHMIHHLNNPKKFLQSAIKVLKPHGFILINEIHTSFLMRLILKIMRHEGWSYETNVFGTQVILDDPQNPWTANCAIPEMLFKNESVFKKQFPELHFVKNELHECFIFLLSGGVIAKSKTIELPTWALRFVAQIDRFLISVFPSFFALERHVVLQKKLL